MLELTDSVSPNTEVPDTTVFFPQPPEQSRPASGPVPESVLPACPGPRDRPELENGMSDYFFYPVPAIPTSLTISNPKSPVPLDEIFYSDDEEYDELPNIVPSLELSLQSEQDEDLDLNLSKTVSPDLNQTINDDISTTVKDKVQPQTPNFY